jgi:predicted nucleic acid-binding protein
MGIILLVAPSNALEDLRPLVPFLLAAIPKSRGDTLEERAREIAKAGISSLDALHLASAEEGQADVLLTCDDVLVRRSRRLSLALRVLNPMAYLEEVKANG